MIVSAYDPDGWECEIPIEEAEAMVYRGEAVYCTPDFGDETPSHYHCHERWPE